MELELLEQQHQENQQVLTKILEVLSIAPVVNVAAPIVNMPAPIVNVPAPVVNVEAPIVNVEKNEVTLNQNEVIELLKVMSKPKPLAEWQFNVVRSSENLIISINAKQIK